MPQGRVAGVIACRVIGVARPRAMSEGEGGGHRPQMRTARRPGACADVVVAVPRHALVPWLCVHSDARLPGAVEVFEGEDARAALMCVCVCVCMRMACIPSLGIAASASDIACTRSQLQTPVGVYVHLVHGPQCPLDIW